MSPNSLAWNIHDLFGYWEESKYDQSKTVRYSFARYLSYTRPSPFFLSPLWYRVLSLPIFITTTTFHGYTVYQSHSAKFRLHTIRCQDNHSQTPGEWLYHLVQNHPMTGPASCTLLNTDWSLMGSSVEIYFSVFPSEKAFLHLNPSPLLLQKCYNKFQCRTFLLCV